MALGIKEFKQNSSSAPASRRAPMPMCEQIAVGILIISFLSVFAIVCLPGRPAPADYISLDAKWYRIQVEHGWPLTFLTRDLAPATQAEWMDHWQSEPAVFDDPFCPKQAPWRTSEGWQFADANATWRPWLAMANAGVAAVASIGIFVACRWRSRRRGSLFRFTLWDVNLAVVAVSAILAWWRAAMTADEQDLASARSLGANATVVQRYCGPDWLARLAGAGRLPFWRTTVIILKEFNDQKADVPSVRERLNAGTFEHIECLALTAPFVEALLVDALQNVRLTALYVEGLPTMTPELRQALETRRLQAPGLRVGGEGEESSWTLEEVVSFIELESSLSDDQTPYD